MFEGLTLTQRCFHDGKRLLKSIKHEDFAKLVFSSPERKAHKVSLYDRTQAGFVRVCVNTFKHEYLRPVGQLLIAIKFYLKHHWSGGKAA